MNAHSLVFVSLCMPNHHKQTKNPTNKVARKLVLMEQDLERSEEKVELAERFVIVCISD